ncbi:6-phospho-3-hexuloisomerase [Desulfurococcus amylolyticus]|uniref:Putative 6-phospho-3-hexuloisomerase n=1 Tax=Desulfurococcus amylolyticus (strain DSM 18924 / JCM 16383 / VKM B-2413 / 1221n) TaxID=490899 RepID=B8D301_DESA1|nr:6-phospho-3-hexuloisomerase [Desulfurococcus amylolyticus]ACL10548.1 putative 6-phospho-3-hexuloisomerase [Desulfurococcus amylolyticus 1221n]
MVSGVTRDAMLGIIDFALKAVDLISDDEKEKMIYTLIDALRNNKKVFVIGAGRSGLVGKAFAMRLLHLGFNTYIVGETILPRASPGDVLVSISGSGRTRLVVAAAEVAKSVGVKVIAITTYPDSPLGKLADIVVRIPGRTKMAAEEDYISRQILGLHEPLAPLGTLFEDTLLIFLDGVIAELMDKLGVTEEELRNRHANIE